MRRERLYLRLQGVKNELYPGRILFLLRKSAVPEAAQSAPLVRMPRADPFQQSMKELAVIHTAHVAQLMQNNIICKIGRQIHQACGKGNTVSFPAAFSAAGTSAPAASKLAQKKFRHGERILQDTADKQMKFFRTAGQKGFRFFSAIALQSADQRAFLHGAAPYQQFSLPSFDSVTWQPLVEYPQGQPFPPLKYFDPVATCTGTAAFCQFTLFAYNPCAFAQNKIQSETFRKRTRHTQNYVASGTHSEP